MPLFRPQPTRTPYQPQPHRRTTPFVGSTGPATSGAAGFYASGRIKSFGSKGVFVSAHLVHPRASAPRWDHLGSDRILYSEHVDIGGNLTFHMYAVDSDFVSNKVALTYGVSGAPQSHCGNGYWFTRPGVGTYILYMAQRDGPSPPGTPGQGWHNDLWVCAADGTGHTRVWQYDTDGSIGSLQPCVSHDGLRVAWASLRSAADANAPYGYWRINTATLSWPGGVPTLSSVANISPVIVDPTPEGKFYETHEFVPDLGAGVYRIIFTGNVSVANHVQETLDIYTCNLDGTGVTRLVGSHGQSGELFNWDEHAHYSPTTPRVISWASNRDNTFVDRLPMDIWLMDTTGANKRRLTFFNYAPGHQHQDGSGLSPAPYEGYIVGRLIWSPDGTQAYVSLGDKAQSDPESGSGPIVRLTGINAVGAGLPTTLLGDGRSVTAGVHAGTATTSIRGTQRVIAIAAKAVANTTRIQGSSREVVLGLKAASNTIRLHALGRLSDISLKVAANTIRIHSASRSSIVSTKSVSTTIRIHGLGRGIANAAKAVSNTTRIHGLSRLSNIAAKSVANTIRIHGLSRNIASATKGAVNTIRIHGSGRLSDVSTKSVVTTIRIHGLGRSITSATKAVSNTTRIHGLSIDIASATKSVANTIYIQGLGSLSDIAVKDASSAVNARIHAVGRLSTIATKASTNTARIHSTSLREIIVVTRNSITTASISATTRAVNSGVKATATITNIRSFGRSITAGVHAGTTTTALRSFIRATIQAAKASAGIASERGTVDSRLVVASARTALARIHGRARIASATLTVISTEGVAALRAIGRMTSTAIRGSSSSTSTRTRSHIRSVGQRASTTIIITTSYGHMAIATVPNRSNTSIIRNSATLRSQFIANRQSTNNIRGASQLRTQFVAGRATSVTLTGFLLGMSSTAEIIIVLVTPTANITLVNQRTADITLHNNATASVTRV